MEKELVITGETKHKKKRLENYLKKQRRKPE